MSTALENIVKLIDQNRLEEALALVGEFIKENPRDDEAFFLRGKIFWRLENRPRAINDFEQALGINPGSKAAVALENAWKIQEFFNPDMFNP